MAKSSIHIQSGGSGYFAHNSRESHTVNSIFTDEQNFCSCTKEEAFETYRSELKNRTEAYTVRTGQKLQKKAVTHLSAIVNFNKEHTPEDIKRVCNLLEKRFDTKVIQFAMHRDEGHLNEDGTPNKNYHAHIEFMGLDSKGESVRRKLDRPTLKTLQTDVAKLLGMERGHDYAKERSPRPKRLDTYEYKTHKERIEREIKEAVLATQKDLKAKIAQLREQLKEQGATRSQYAAIEQLNKELKEQIKANNLTIDQLKERFEAEKRAATELAREMGIVKPTDLKNYTAKSLLPEIQKKFNAKIENLEAENKAIRAENKALRDEIEEKSKDLERIEFLYGQVDGMLEAGATSEELKELSRVHEPYKPKQRAAYQTAKERALAAYRDRIRPTKTTAPQTTDEPILKTQYQTAGDDDEPIFGMTQNKIRGRAEDETIFKNR